jgi:hypothetical protein
VITVLCFRVGAAFDVITVLCCRVGAAFDVITVLFCRVGAAFGSGLRVRIKGGLGLGAALDCLHRPLGPRLITPRA